MKRLLVLLLLLTIVAARLEFAKPVRACVIDPHAKPDDPVGESELIVAGRVTDWTAQYPPDLQQYDYAEIGVDVTLAVDKVFKGEKSSKVVFHRPDALVYNGDYEGRPPDLPRFEWGYETDCGPVGFQSDPKGKYVLVGLNESIGSADPAVPSGAMTVREVFFEGAGLDGPGYDNAVHKVTSNGFPVLLAIGFALLWPLAFLVGAAFLWRRGEPHNG